MAATFPENCVIRQARLEDCQQLLALIQEENVDKKTKTTLDAETLRKDGFGEEPLFHCFVAIARDAASSDINHGADRSSTEQHDSSSSREQLLGYAMYLDYYAEYDGPYVFLENIYVPARYKEKGIEEQLLREVARVAVRTPTVSMTWVRSRGQIDSNVVHEPTGTVNRTLQENIAGFHVLEDGLKSIAESGKEADDGIVIRDARPEDCEQIIDLMKGLAVHERAPPSVVHLTADDLRRDGFGPRPLYHCHVAEHQGRLAGHTLYVLHYSSREQRVSIFLQDLFVLAGYRGRGVGSRLFTTLAKEALQRGCTRMLWRAYEWNKEAVQFYNGKGATNLSEKYETHYLSLSDNELKAFAAAP